MVLRRLGVAAPDLLRVKRRRPRRRILASIEVLLPHVAGYWDIHSPRIEPSENNRFMPIRMVNVLRYHKLPVSYNLADP